MRRFLSRPPKLCGKAALARLAGSPSGPYETELGEGGAHLPARGQTIPFIVADLALPKDRLNGVRVVHLSPRVSRILQDPERRMLRPKAEAEALLKGTRSYQDPVVDLKAVLLELLLRLHRGGMLAATDRKEA